MALTQISTAGVKDDAVTAGKIPADAIGSSEIAANAVGSSELADNAVDTAAIADNAVTTAKIGSEQVVAANIAGGTITAGKLASNSVTNAKVADDAIGIAELSATGTASSSTFLRGDNSWTAVTSTTINSNTNNYLITGTGTANELQGESELQWNGSNLFVRAGEGESSSLNLIADQGDDNGDGWKIQSEQDENDLTFKSNTSGSYVDKLKLKPNGNLEVQGDILLADSDKLNLGAGNDLKIYHDGSNSYLDNEVGSLILRDTGGAEKFKINGYGAHFQDDVTFYGTNNNIQFDKTADAFEFKDNAEARFGDGDDLKVYHDGSHTRIKNTTGHIVISSDSLDITNAADNENIAKFDHDGSVSLYHNSSKKIETTSYGSHFTGYKSQSSYVGFFVMGTNQDHGYGTNHGSGITTYDVDYYSPIPMWSNKTIDHGSSYLSFPSYASGNYLKFTAPVAGLYQFELIASVESHHGGDWCQIGWEVNTTTNNNSSNFMNNNRGVSSVNQRAGDDTEMGCHHSTTIWLDENDYAVLYQQSTAAVRWRGNQYYARGHLIS